VTTRTRSTAAQVREQLDHPVIDCDGHVVEHAPVMLPFMRDALGPRLFADYTAGKYSPMWAFQSQPLEERVQTRMPQGGWWGLHTRNALDRATVMLPGLLAERLPELGIDYAVLYPTSAFGVAGHADDDLRRGLCRGYNEYASEVYGPYRDRYTVVGVVPMHTPAEAIDELEHCHRLGLKVVAFPHGVLRQIPKPIAGPAPYVFPGQTWWLDVFGLDSAHDYSPVWRRCTELGFAATFHGGLLIDPKQFTSISNFMYNHLGFFAAQMQPLCKAMFLGGVTRAFPNLSFGLLECGVGWAAILLADLIEHWERRNVTALAALDPAHLSVEVLEGYFRQYGDARFQADESLAALAGLRELSGPVPEDLDDWRYAGITSAEDIVQSFVPSFYFGAEADDRTLAFAFSDANPFGARLRAIFSSDVGHWDVEDMAKVLPHAFSMVEDGLVTPDDFRAFTFDNPVSMLTSTNPAFFDDTVIAVDPVHPTVDEELRP
jgi:predicted TIM-barrel fold metal-dependent hydrolase